MLFPRLHSNNSKRLMLHVVVLCTCWYLAVHSPSIVALPGPVVLPHNGRPLGRSFLSLACEDAAQADEPTWQLGHTEATWQLYTLQFGHIKARPHDSCAPCGWDVPKPARQVPASQIWINWEMSCDILCFYSLPLILKPRLNAGGPG